MSDPKTLMQISTCGFGAKERPIVTVELDGSVTYGAPMTQDELKAALRYVISKGMQGGLVSQAITSMFFGSELARLSAENKDLKKRLGLDS